MQESLKTAHVRTESTFYSSKMLFSCYSVDKGCVVWQSGELWELTNKTFSRINKTYNCSHTGEKKWSITHGVAVYCWSAENIPHWCHIAVLQRNITSEWNTDFVSEVNRVCGLYLTWIHCCDEFLSRVKAEGAECVTLRVLCVCRFTKWET